MSSRRSIAWLLFLTALAVGAHLLVTWRAGNRPTVAGPAVLVPKADRADFVELLRVDTQPVRFVRTATWRMTEPFASAVEKGTLLRLVDALAFAGVTDTLTASAMHRLGRSLEDFGLEKPRLRVTVGRGADAAVVDFGTLTPAGDGVYARLASNQTVCVIPTNAFAAIDLPLEAFRRRELLPEGLGRTVSVDVRRPSRKFIRMECSDQGVWRMLEPQEAAVSSTRVQTLLQDLSAAGAVRFVWPDRESKVASLTPAVLAGWGLDVETAATVTLKGSDGGSRSVSFGKGAGDGLVYALVQDGGAVVTVRTEVRDRLFAAADALVDLRLFPFEEKDLTILSIVDGETSYLLARTPAGEWRLDSPVAAPADPQTVHALVQSVLSLRTTDRDAHGMKVSVSTNAESVAVSRDALLVQNRLEDLRAKTVVKLPADGIRRLTLTSSGGRNDCVTWDAENRSWILTRPEGAKLDGLALARLLGALDPLTAESVVRLRIAASENGNYGLETPRFTIAVDARAEGTVRRNILIGSALPDGGAYATVGATDAVFVLSAEAVRTLTLAFALPSVSQPTK